MSSNINQEIKVGKQAARKLQRSLRSVIKQETNRRTGLMQKSKITAKPDRYLKNHLDRLTISSPHYSFKLHYGFERVKANGELMKFTGTDHFNIALNQSNTLEDLATEISELRADEFVTKINF